MKKISILGSTGSIGTQTLEIVRDNKDIKIISLAANSNISLLEKQIREFNPELVCVFEKDRAEELKIKVSDTNVKIVSGIEGLIEAAVWGDSQMVVTAFVGMIGIRPTIEAIRAGKDIALANKETLVTAGHIIMPLVKEYGVKIHPVDSEHSAVFQCLNGEKRDQLSRILLTASGGPFRGYSAEMLKIVTKEEALKHPNWSMGKKITIDSATMVNKGLEVIEARWLFEIDVEQIEVVVQPESLIHSMVEFVDGGIMAQLGTPDMKLPIQYAIYYPERKQLTGKRVDFATLSEIRFEKPDLETFRGLKLSYEAVRRGGSLPVVLNAANEKAVEKFLTGSIKFLDIYDIIQSSMDDHKVIETPTVEEILEIETEIYKNIESRW